MRVIVDDVNDNPPHFVQMILMPDHAVQLATTSGEDDVFLRNSDPHQRITATGDRHHNMPMLQVPENVTLGVPLIRLTARDIDDETPTTGLHYAITSERLEDGGKCES